MDRLTQPQLTALLDFVRGVYACLDREAFVPHLLSTISRLIPAESTSYAEVHIESGRLLAASSVEPAAIEFPGCRQIFERHIHEYPFSPTGSRPATARPSRSRTSSPNANSTILACTTSFSVR